MDAERVRTVIAVLERKRCPGMSQMFHTEFHALLATIIVSFQKTDLGRMTGTYW